MTAEQQMMHLNHKIGRDEAVLDCMNAIEAMQEKLYEDIEARKSDIDGARIQGYDLKKDPVVMQLRAQIDILYVMHKKFVSL
jgi:hypothetical protein